MKILEEQKTILPEVALSFMVDTIRDWIYKNEKSKDKTRREIALKELDVLENSITKAIK